MRLNAEAGLVTPPSSFPHIEDPTDREREEHELGQHYPPRTWCEHCQMAKGRDKPQELIDASVERLPVIGMDLCFLKGDTSGPRVRKSETSR